MGGSDRKCAVCVKTSARRCTGCDKAWYCSAECQKKDWVRHIFECNPNRPITTADRLALAVSQRGMTLHSQTRLDYGFRHATTRKLENNIFWVYYDMFTKFHFKAQAIHKAQDMERAYESLPASERGPSYDFFVKNKHIHAELGGNKPPPTKLDLASANHAVAMDMGRQVWEAIGGRPGISAAQIQNELRNMPPKRQDCVAFYVSFVEGSSMPLPGFPEWRAFGFCACANAQESGYLMNIYGGFVKLKMCTFDEFCAAYEQHKLIELIYKTGAGALPEGHPILDVLNDPSEDKKSVWVLKEHVLSYGRFRPDKSVPPPPAAYQADYGFVNCKDAEERKKLRALYRAFFDLPDHKPLLLHEAAMDGQLLEYLGRALAPQIELTPRKLYGRLLRNKHTRRSK